MDAPEAVPGLILYMAQGDLSLLRQLLQDGAAIKKSSAASAGQGNACLGDIQDKALLMQGGPMTAPAPWRSSWQVRKVPLWSR